MDCFPIDEEIQASVPFSNNSVVLAASALLQRLVSYADERNLQSVDVLLSSIWLLLREERGKDSGQPYITSATCKSPIKRTPSETTTQYKCLYTEAETQTDDRITEIHSADTDEIENQIKQDDARYSYADTNSNDKGDKDRVSNTAKIQPFVTGNAHAELQVNADRISFDNKLFGSKEVKNHVIDKAGSGSAETAVDNSLRSKGRLLECPPVLSPIKPLKEPLDDNPLSSSDTKGKAQNSNLPSDVKVDYSTDLKSVLTETDLKGSETILNTSESNIFQISSNDGLTYENIVIENVGSDDSDTQMTIDYDDQKFDSSQASLKFSLDNDIIPQNNQENKGNPVLKHLHSGNAHQKLADIHNSAMGIAKNEEIVIENLEIPQGNCLTDTPEPPVRESFGGIVEPDTDSELKIINIAGGVTFYDDPNQEDLPNDRNIDYVEKPNVSVYNPFAYSGFPSIQSSCTSPYSDVVFSSYSSFPGTYMSVNPRLTVQNCPQYFFPNNLNMGMYVGANEVGQIYKPEEILTKNGNSPPSFNQGFQYFFPQPQKTDFSEPVEVKSEARVITATSPKSKKKRRKQEQEENPLSVNKDYYNVRDKNGKFIKMEEMPYINNVKHSRFSLKGHKLRAKIPVKQDQKTGGLPEDANGSLAKLMRPLSGDRQGMKIASTSDQQDDAKLCVSQLQEECEATNKKLKALVAKKSAKSISHKTFEKRQLNLLKKLRSLKRKLRKFEKCVVRDNGTFVNSAGMHEEYTVVTLKDPVSISLVEQNCSKLEQTAKTHYNDSDGAKSKNNVSLKDSKGKKMLKKSSGKGKVKPLGNSNSKIKTAKQKLAAKKVLKIKKAKTRQILKETVGKNNLKLKSMNSVDELNSLVKPAEPSVSEATGEVKKRGRGRPRKGEEKNRVKLKVKSPQNSTKTDKKTKAYTWLKQARKEKEQPNVKEILIAAYHGERGAKLAAQQKISAYNESLSLDNGAKGENL